jgi:hypothetical protein
MGSPDVWQQPYAEGAVMPTRILRDWTDSETVNKLDNFSEVVFLRLIMKADDFGRFSGNPKLLRSLLFPLRDGVKESEIDKALSICEKAGLIVRYIVSGKSLLEIVNFKQRTRARVSKFPAPVADTCQTHDGHMTDICQTNDRLDGDGDGDGDGDTSCSELRSEPDESAEPIALEFQTTGKVKTWALTEKQAKEFASLYPAVNVILECRRAAAWMDANPQKRKTAKGMLRFLNAWLTKAQDRGGGIASKPAGPKKDTRYNPFPDAKDPTKAEWDAFVKLYYATPEPEIPDVFGHSRATESKPEVQLGAEVANDGDAGLC